MDPASWLELLTQSLALKTAKQNLHIAFTAGANGGNFETVLTGRQPLGLGVDVALTDFRGELDYTTLATAAST